MAVTTEGAKENKLRYSFCHRTSASTNSYTEAMNYLAHAYLSFNDPGVLTGNMISDYIKGRKKFDYPAPVFQGIMLHRYIDTFTDRHEATGSAKEVFRPDYRLYSGAMVDVAYDHFLATDAAEFPGEALLGFSQSVYNTLDQYNSWFPPPFAAMFPYMKQHNWLYHYRTVEGTGRSFRGVMRRAAYLNETDMALRLFEKNYELLKSCYHHFWNDMKPFARQQYELLKG